MIRNSLEWEEKQLELREKLRELPFNNDLRKMLKNIELMVKELSIAEVAARRNKNSSSTVELKKVNDAIATLEQWIMMAVLIR